VRNDRRFWRAGCPRRRGRPKLPCAHTRARRELEGQGREEAKGVSDVVLEYLAFRQRKVQNPQDPGVVLAKHSDRAQDRSRLFQKQWIARENPASITPRSNGVLAEPAPDGGSADLRYQPLSENFLPDVGNREAREGQALAMRQLTSESFYLHDETGGKSGPDARREVHARGRVSGPDRSACATC